MLKGITMDLCILSLIAIIFVPMVGFFFSEGSVLYNVFMIVILSFSVAAANILAVNRFEKKPKYKEEPNNMGVGLDWWP